MWIGRGRTGGAVAPLVKMGERRGRGRWGAPKAGRQTGGRSRHRVPGLTVAARAGRGGRGEAAGADDTPTNRQALKGGRTGDGGVCRGGVTALTATVTVAAAVTAAVTAVAG